MQSRVGSNVPLVLSPQVARGDSVDRLAEARARSKDERNRPFMVRRGSPRTGFACCLDFAIALIGDRLITLSAAFVELAEACPEHRRRGTARQRRHCRPPVVSTSSTNGGTLSFRTTCVRSSAISTLRAHGNRMCGTNQLAPSGYCERPSASSGQPGESVQCREAIALVSEYGEC